MQTEDIYFTDKRRVIAWIAYDFANSSFVTVIITAFYVLYFKAVVVGGESGLGDFYWGLATSLSALILAVNAPFLGALADKGGAKKRLLVTFALFCVVSTALLWLVPPGAVFWGAAIFIVANIGFEAANIFYNALLPYIAPREKLGRISGFGWAFGYFGGIGCLLLALPLAKDGFGSENIETARLIFPMVAIFFLLSAIPSFLWLPEPSGTALTSGLIENFSESWKEVFNTSKRLPKNKNLSLFLLAYFFYEDGITTIIKFSSAFAVASLGFSVSESIQLLIVINLTAAAGAFAFGFVADKIGAKKSIIITLIIWLAVVLAAFLVTSKGGFWIIANLAGISLGSSQSLSRTLMAKLAPKERTGEYFGFMAICGRFSAIIGPLLFGAVSFIAQSQRPAVLAIAMLFAVGLALILKVKEPTYSESQFESQVR
ncbi:MAG: MFS transporter [Myxococcota bacterium]